MQGMTSERRSLAPIAFGLILVIAGAAVFVLRQAGIDVIDMAGEGGWPFFIIAPGVVLLTMAVLAGREDGPGFAIGGSVVTTVGLILLYQQSTGHWESWAYVWALIPAAVGMALALHGIAFRTPDMVRTGFRMAAVAAAGFVAGFWFFESVFDTGRAPVDLGTWWPAILVVVGLLIAGRALLGSTASDERAATDAR
jgi:hypothetical protein